MRFNWRLLERTQRIFVHSANGSRWLICVSYFCVISGGVKLPGLLRTQQEPEAMEHGSRTRYQVRNDVQRSVELNGRRAPASHLRRANNRQRVFRVVLAVKTRIDPKGSAEISVR